MQGPVDEFNARSLKDNDVESASSTLAVQGRISRGAIEGTNVLKPGQAAR